MHITTHFTRNTLHHPENIRFVTYVRRQTDVSVFVSDTRNWHTGDMIAGHWQELMTRHPQFAVEFQEGHHTLEFLEGRLVGEIE